ncbi:hypothetical protein [Cellulosimicrobium sp. CUA-896]|uniref:hypothetical protein n=1 Tax=Cellulosimicrobium sp. CUA-896 TaxID=1517881 RepID=UPI0009667692|nr:hypothetical protein [Cellulosimicrobium sp. CUA-896]OLT52241.1 hypothetical protein BJF88_14185 [Cellulosimicrobium sp. CUA-896]
MLKGAVLLTWVLVPSLLYHRFGRLAPQDARPGDGLGRAAVPAAEPTPGAPDARAGRGLVVTGRRP